MKLKDLYKKIDKEELKFIAIVTLIFMVISHGYCYFNLNFSHDSMFSFSEFTSVNIGRGVIDLFGNMRGHYFPPLLIGSLTYIFLLGTVYLLINIFQVKKKINTFLLSGIFVTASTITLLNATYIDFSDIYSFAIFIITLAAYIFINKKDIVGYLISIILLVIGLSTYQSYISFFIGIVILYSIKNCIEKDNYRMILINGLKAIFVVALSLILYSLFSKLIIIISNSSFATGYNSISDVGNFANFNEIITTLKRTYTTVFNYILHPSIFYSNVVSFLNLLIIIVNIVIVSLIFVKNKVPKENIILTFLLILLLPFGINIACFLSKGFVHELMIYALFLLYIFPVIMLERDLFKLKLSNIYKKSYTSLITISYIIIIFLGIVYSNQCYLKKNFEFDNTITTMNRILNRIEEIDGYEVGKTKVAFIGTLQDGPLSKFRKEFDYGSVGLFANFSVTYYETYKLYFANYLSYPINIIPEYEAVGMSKKSEVKEMGVFPNKDSVKKVDDVIIVKLS